MPSNLAQHGSAGPATRGLPAPCGECPRATSSRTFSRVAQARQRRDAVASSSRSIPANRRGAPAGCPARLPLSTVETYSGNSGLSERRVVPVVEMAAVTLHAGQGAERLAAVRSSSLAGAAIAEVAGGQVRQQRHADVGRAGARGDASAGFSWKLSGGSQFSSAVTKTSKKRQVRRDSFCRKTRCASDRWTGGGGSGRLSHQATSGETSHRPSSGPATSSMTGSPDISRSSDAATASAGPNHMVRKKPAQVGALAPRLGVAGGLPLQHLLLRPEHPR